MTSAAYKAYISKAGTTPKKKGKKFPYESPGVKKMREHIAQFAQRYPKILQYFSNVNPHYRKAWKYFYQEDLFQIAVCAWLREYFKGVEILHPKNEGKARHVEQAKKVLMGVEKGASDLLLQKEGLKDFWMELKVKPNSPTKDQKLFIEKQRNLGNMAEIAYNLQEVESMVKGWISQDEK